MSQCFYSTDEVNRSLKSFQTTGHHCFVIAAQFASFDSGPILDFLLRTCSVPQEQHHKSGHEKEKEVSEYTTV